MDCDLATRAPRRAIGWWALLMLAPASASAQAPTSMAATEAEAPPPSDPRADALLHFEKGKAFYKADAFAAALPEFLESRRLYATRNATLNAALCLGHLQRLDEALEMYETLLRDFPELPDQLKQTVQREMVRLKGLVGVVDITQAEAGAAIAIDGRSRGGYPPVTLLRVSAGSHIVRVYKEGFEPFEGAVDVAGGSTVSVVARLRSLQQPGRMSVTERSGKSLDVIIDGSLVGTTPWVGPLAPGDHTVFLRGVGNAGTQPVYIPVTLGRTTPLVLDAEELNAFLRVNPTPAGAAVAVDGVAVGHGVWEGRLRTGAHKIEVAEPGFVTSARDLSLDEGARLEIAVPLERDARSPFWKEPPRPSRFLVELSGGPLILPNFGGDIAGACAGACSAPPGLGVAMVVRGGYELSFGLGLGLAVGYVFAQQTVSDRQTTLYPIGIDAESRGAASDVLAIRRGALVGLWLGFSVGGVARIHGRLSAGGLFASVTDTRTGAFTAVHDGPKTSVGPVTAEVFVPFVYLAPGLSVSYRVFDRFDIQAGVDALVLVPTPVPMWYERREVNAGVDGIGTFAEERLLGSVLFGVTPALGVRYDFL